MPALLTGLEKKDELKKRWYSIVSKYSDAFVVLTEDVYVSIFDAVDTLFHRLVTADVQFSHKKSFAVQIPSSFHQIIFTFQVTHRSYYCRQHGDRKEKKDKK